MNFEDLHNDLNSFPEELNFSDARWEEALSVIKAHEAKRRRVAWGGAFSALAVLIVISFLAVQQNSEVTSEFTPRKEVQSLDSRVKTEVKTTSTSKELIRNPENEDFKLHSNKLSEKNNIKIENSNSRTSTLDVLDENLETLLTKKITLNNPVYPVQNRKIDAAGETEKRDFYDPNVLKVKGLSQDLSNILCLAPLTKTFSLLKMSHGQAILKGDRISIGKKGFKMQSKFLALKALVSPWAEFGRSNKLGKLSPTYGIDYQYPLTRNVSVSASVEYSSIENIDLPVSSAQTVYGLGFESNVTTVHTKKIHLINVPLNLVFRPIPRVQLSSGLGLSYLLTASNNLEEHLVKNNSSTILSSSGGKGYITSFNRLMVYSRVGINYWFSERNSLQVGLQYGLSDFSSDDAFKSNEKDKNSKMNIGLSRAIK